MSRPELRVEVPDSEVAESEVISMAGQGAVEVEEPVQAPRRSAFTPRGLLDRTAELVGLGPKARTESTEGRVSVNPISMAAADASYATQQKVSESEQDATVSYRQIRFAPQLPADKVPPNVATTNRVVTSKYNIVSFLPIFLFEMFSRVAYLYFLLQAGLSWWSVVSPFGGVGSTAALLFVLVVAAVKAIWEDVKRHQEDKRMNTSITHRVNPDGSVSDIPWTDVRVGDAIEVRDDELFPSDLLCLHSTLPDNVCFIKTTNLDGETNLKIRKPLDLRGLRPADGAGVMRLDIALTAELPNRNLHKFKGSAAVADERYRAPLTPGAEPQFKGPADQPAVVKIPATMNEMLLRGCMLKNSGSIIGLVVYTGKETRIQMNAAKTPLKVGSFDRFLNFQIVLVIAMQLGMCLFFAVASYVWVRTTGRDHYYLALGVDVEGVYASPVAQIFINFITFWILLSYLVPISLFVSLEIVKLWQGFVFINMDPRMRDPHTKEHARCRNSNLNEDLGKVEYIFSDKTGTLTSNEMQLREIAIKGQEFGSRDFRLEDRRDLSGLDALQCFDARLAAAAERVQGSASWSGLVSSGGSREVVMAHHTSFPDLASCSSLGIEDSVSPRSDGAAQPARGGGSHDWDSGTTALGHHLLDFWTNICICQSLILEHNPTGGPDIYQGPSPDEVALVEAARQLGFEFINRGQSAITLCMLGDEVKYEILNVMEYSSERGCMSVIARAPDGTIRLFCKGSDAKVMKKIRASTAPDLVAATDANLHSFAQQGLRTLVLASKIVGEDAYADWDARYQEAARSFQGRDAKLDALGMEMERDLELIGVTAIEDKLQDGVPAAISTLMEAGIRVWMITGDKQETAVNIAVSCRLVSDPQAVLMLNVNDKGEDPEGAVSKLLDSFLDRCLRAYREGGGNGAAARPEDIPEEWQGGELAVDGPTLTLILEDARHLGLPRKLALLAAHCRGVVVSRSSPSQKAAIVRLVTKYEMDKAAGGRRGLRRWYARYQRRLQGKMLAIGDGANDVAMLQTADVGVGIMGKEGRQAVNNSDYAFSQFRFLVPLLLIHGNLSYYRLARLIKYSFYKNIAFAFMLFFYQFYNGFSGQALIDSITAAVYNVFFTSIPILLFAVLDRPVKNLDAFVRYPQLYDKRHSRSLTTVSFWKTGVGLGLVHGAICFFVPYYSIATSGAHNITDVWSLGKVAFVALLGVVNMEMALVARYWTWVYCVCVVLSYVLVYPFMLIFPLVELAIGYYDASNVNVAENVFANPTFWLVILAIYILAFGYRFAERTAAWLFHPHDTMILAEKERYEPLLAGMSSKSRKRLLELGTVRFRPTASGGVDVEGAASSAEADIANTSLRNRYSPPSGAAAPDGGVAPAGREPPIPEDASLGDWSSLQPAGGAAAVDGSHTAQRLRSVQFSRHVRSASGSVFETRG